MSKSRLAIFVAIACLLSACDPSAKQVTFPVLPDELKDCTFHYISGGLNGITVARCPNSTTSTTYRSGKTTRTTVVIDGVEYTKKEPSHE